MSTLVLYLLAFCSGFAALVYQVAWSRMLSMSFGSSTLAVSAVVAGFMGGMGIGAWLYHRVGNRAEIPLRAYGLLEIAIAITTAIFTLLFQPLPHWFSAVAEFLPPGAAMDVVRVLSAFMLLLVPSALMGATYPALCQTMIRTADEIEGRLGWIYGLNTLGAALGALLAGFVMIEMLGSHGSVYVANAINLGVGIVALWLARASKGSVTTGSVADDPPLECALPAWVVGVILFGSGFATLGYEIVWFRALHYVMGSGTYVLSTALVIFLLGLGIGGTSYRVALRIGKPEWNLGIIQLIIGILAVVAIGAEHWMLTNPEINNRFNAFSKSLVAEAWQTRAAVGFMISLLMMLPATIFMGLSFPLATRLFLGSVQGLSARVGVAYLLSNLGSITGAIGAAVWILPTLGTAQGTKFLAGVNLLLGLLVLYRVDSRPVRRLSWALVAILVVVSTTAPSRLAMQKMLRGKDKNNLALQFEEESDRGTVQVYESTNLPGAAVMVIDGAIIAVTEEANRGLYAKQMLLAHLPMSLDRNIKHTLNLGVASASTLKTLSRYKWVETLDAVEINPAVIRGAGYFLDSQVFSDPRTEIYVEDAVHYLLRTPKTYDLIISDAKQDPRFVGNAKLLSSEFYGYALDRLSECGLFVQFLAIGISDEYHDLVLRTFNAAFPEVEVFLAPPVFMLTIGSRCPIAGRERPAVDELAHTDVGLEIARNFLPQVDALPALWVASGAELAQKIGDGPLNSWDKLPMEFMSYRLPPMDTPRSKSNMESMMAPRRAGLPCPPEFCSLPHFDSLQMVNEAYIDWMAGERERAIRKASRALAQDPENILARGAYDFVNQAN